MALVCLMQESFRIFSKSDREDRLDEGYRRVAPKGLCSMAAARPGYEVQQNELDVDNNTIR
jgi:hypothetical protein